MGAGSTRTAFCAPLFGRGASVILHVGSSRRSGIAPSCGSCEPKPLSIWSDAPANSRRCAIYTRKSHEDVAGRAPGSLSLQREAGEAYIRSQAGEGWKLLPDRYDDSGYSGGTLRRPGLERLRADIRAGRIDLVVVYKVDRLTRSLRDFAVLVSELEAAGAAFVAVTQSIDTSTSTGRLMLNVLLSFAQFEAGR